MPARTHDWAPHLAPRVSDHCDGLSGPPSLKPVLLDLLFFARSDDFVMPPSTTERVDCGTAHGRARSGERCPLQALGPFDDATAPPSPASPPTDTRARATRRIPLPAAGRA